jgi:hypothetical protein
MAAMAVFMVVLFVFAQKLVDVSYSWIDLVVIIPMMIFEPFLIAFIARVYDAIGDFFAGIHDFFYERFHHDQMNIFRISICFGTSCRQTARKGTIKIYLFLDFDGVINVFYQQGTPEYEEMMQQSVGQL